jgi:outer membrane protein, multidrug efflux system
MAAAPEEAIDADPDLAPPSPAAHTLRSFEQAFALLRARSPQYLSAQAELERAVGQASIALSAVLPQVGAVGMLTHELITTRQSLGDRTVQIPSQDVWGAGATASLAIGDVHAWHAWGSARRGVRAAQYALADARRTLLRGLLDAIVAEVAAERLAAQHRDGLRAALARLALTTVKVELGGARALDVDRAQQDVIEARKLLVTGDEAVLRARESLALLLGSAVPLGVSPRLPLAALGRALAAACRLGGAIEQRSDVAAARERVAVAERGIIAADLQRLPRLALGGALQWDSGVVYGPNSTFNLRATLSVPIWDGGELQGQKQQARATAARARAELAEVRARALVGAAQDDRAVFVAARSAELAAGERAVAQRIDQRTREGYAHGFGTSLELVSAAQALRRAEIEATVLGLRAEHARWAAALAHAECSP